MKLTVLQRCKSLFTVDLRDSKFLYLILAHSMYQKTLKTGMLLHRQPKPRRLVGYLEEPMHFSKFVVKLLELTYL